MRDDDRRLQTIIDQKTKPPGSLGRLEALALQLGRIQGSEQPTVERPTVLVFAGDHGAVEAGVSSYPQAVTAQMVLNFLAGGAAINVFCRLHDMELTVIDAGVNADLPSQAGLIDTKVGRGTSNYLERPAMTMAQFDRCLQEGELLIEELCRSGCNTVGFGEMGIGNTASASLLMSALCGLPLARCVGRGAGADDRQLQHKLELLEAAQRRHGTAMSPGQLMQTYGGFELAQMCGAMLAARDRGLVILIDGFISSATYLVAVAMEPRLAEHAIFCHRSAEQGHGDLLEYLGALPLLDIDLRLGEGTGCALALPLLRAAVAFVAEMASFSSAGISVAT